MTKEFKYLKERLTSDLIQFLMQDYGLNMQALSTVYDSDTYSKICDFATGLYFQGSRYVYSYLKNELQTNTSVHYGKE